jgi:Tfp pilus assembly protein PilO
MEDSFSKQYRKYYQNIEPVLVKPKNKTYSTAVFFLLVISLFAWYAIRPTIQTILYLQREIADKSKVNEQMDEKINSLIQAEAAYESVLEQIPTLKEALPEDPSVLVLLDQIKTIGAEAQASVSAVQLSSSPLTQTDTEDQTKKKQAVNKLVPIELPITITMMGKFPNIHTFLQSLGNMRRLFRFESISVAQNVNTPTLGEPAGELNLSLRLTAFFTKEK